MSLFDRLFGRRSVDKIIDGLQDDEWVNVEVPDTPWHRVHDLPLHIHQIPPMGEEKPDGVNVMVTTYADADIKPYRTCVIIGTGGPVARCQMERERDIYHNLMVEYFATCPPDDKRDKLCESRVEIEKRDGKWGWKITMEEP